jgi:transposase
MNQKYFIGIDISKGKLDCATILSDFTVVDERVILNKIDKITSFFKLIAKTYKVSYDQIAVCCENTGIYNNLLRETCLKLKISLWEEHAPTIKRASSDIRGKSDRKDAMRIAEYLVRYQDRAKPTQQTQEELRKLDRLNKCRETLMGHVNALVNQLGESKTYDQEGYIILKKYYRKSLKQLKAQIKEVEAEIAETLKKDEQINNNVSLMTSIPGVGKQTAIALLLHTGNFTLFSSVKQLACYAGVVPFQNESGTITKRARVSKMATKKLKTILHMAAMGAVRAESEVKEYYINQVKKGKNKMSALNAVRNKILHRVWAVIQRQTPYLPKEEYFRLNSN